jgi:2'-5' RNA ligase
MRVFVAVKLPNKTRDNLARSAVQLKQFSTQGNFVNKENYHITLHFLGEVPESDLIYIQSAMDGIKDLPAPKLALSQFTILRGGDIVCSKIRQNGNSLTNLHDQLGDLLESHNFTVEHRAYRPHVTLIRKYGFSLPFSEVTKSVDVYNMPFDATEVVLYQSVFNDSGVSYKELYSVSLQPEE